MDKRKKTWIYVDFWENIMRKGENGQEKIAILELAHPGGRELKKLPSM